MVMRPRPDDDSLALFESEQSLPRASRRRAPDASDLAAFGQEPISSQTSTETIPIHDLALVGPKPPLAAARQSAPFVPGRTAGSAGVGALAGVGSAIQRRAAATVLALSVCGVAVLYVWHSPDPASAGSSAVPPDTPVSSSIAAPPAPSPTLSSGRAGTQTKLTALAGASEAAAATPLANGVGLAKSPAGAASLVHRPVAPSISAGAGQGPWTPPALDPVPLFGPTAALPPSLDAVLPLAAPAVSVDPPPLTASVAESRNADVDAVRQALRQYERAYEDLDVVAAARIWPSVDRRALSRAFGTIRSQGLSFENCEIQVSVNSATARCRGAIRFVPKVGSRIPITAQQEWLFRMQKRDTSWQIGEVIASRPL